MKLLQSNSQRAGDPVNFSLSAIERDRICLDCPLRDCVGIESRECPIRIEQRRVWREKHKQRRETRRIIQDPPANSRFL